MSVVTNNVTVHLRARAHTTILCLFATRRRLHHHFSPLFRELTPRDFDAPWDVCYIICICVRVNRRDRWFFTWRADHPSTSLPRPVGWCLNLLYCPGALAVTVCEDEKTNDSYPLPSRRGGISWFATILHAFRTPRRLIFLAEIRVGPFAIPRRSARPWRFDHRPPIINITQYSAVKRSARVRDNLLTEMNT